MGYFISTKAWNDPAKQAAAVAFVEHMTSGETMSNFVTTEVTALKNGAIIPVFRMEAAWGIAGSGNRWLSLLAVILPQIAGNLCFATIVLMGFIQSVPIDLEESAYVDGYNVFQVYFHIIMPAAKFSFATVAIFSFLWSYNDLFTQNFFLRFLKERTITLLLNEISSQAGVDYGLMAASVVLIVIPVLAVYVMLQKNIIKGLTAGAVKG